MQSPRPLNRLSRSQVRFVALLLAGVILAAATALAFAGTDGYAAAAGAIGWLVAGVVAGWLAARLEKESQRRKLLTGELAAVRDVASEAILGVDADGTIVDWGTGAEAMYGYSADEAIGQPLSLLTDGDDELREAIEATERIEGLRGVHRRKQGDELTVSVSVAPIALDGGGAAVVVADVGEPVRLTDALRESEAKYRSLTEHLPDVTYVYPVGERGAPLHVSGQVEQLLGYSPAQWLSEPGLFAKLVHPDDRDRVLAGLAGSHDGVEPFRGDYRMLARDGRVVWVRDESVTVRDGQGNALYVHGYLRDISDRIRSDEEKASIREAEERARAETREKQRKLDFLAQAHAALASSSVYDTTLRRVAELAVRDLADWCVVDVLDHEGTLIRLAAAHSEPRTSPEPEPGPDPEPEVAEVVRSMQAQLSESRISAPLIARGRALGAITFVTSTPGRSFGSDDLALVESLATAAALAVDDARLQGEVEERADAARVLTYVADGVFLLDRGGVIRLWNPAAEAITGLDALSVVGHPAVQGITGWEALAERIPVGEASDPPAAATLPLETDRGERWISISGVEFFGGTVYAFRDLTESRRLEEMKADFLATASHELRTPLAAVYGAAQTLRRHDFALDESGRARFIELIVDESDRLGRIVNEILLANQLDLGLLDLATEPFDPVELVERVVETTRVHLPPGIEIDLAAHDEVPAVAADRDKVRQILTNLVENAIKYSPDGGRIELAVEPQNGVVRFAVRDEGLGIPAEEQARIFDKFYRLDPDMTRGVGGTGLGLYICSELVERMGGRIWVESEQPGGSEFVFEIPAEDSRRQRQTSTAARQAPSA